MSDTGIGWVGVGGIFAAGANTFEHMSAHRALGRMELIERWEDIVDSEDITPTPQLVKRWAQMDCAPFWQALQVGVAQQRVRFNSDLFWTLALEDAGGAGNLAAFEVAPVRALHDYATWEKHAPHPDVGLWLHAQGLVSMDFLRSQVVRDYCMADNSFGRCKDLEPMAPEYVVNWCVRLLRDYGLSDAQKVGVVGQALRAFGPKVWGKHLAAVCEPFVEGLDMGLLKTLCMRPQVNATPLDTMIARLAQYDNKSFNPNLLQPAQEGEDPMLRMLVELAPPQNRLDLYFLAFEAKRAQQPGSHAMESLELPTLG